MKNTTTLLGCLLLLNVSCATTKTTTVDKSTESETDYANLSQDPEVSTYNYFERDKAAFLGKDTPARLHQPFTDEELAAELTFQEEQELAQSLMPEEEQEVPTAKISRAPGMVHSPYGIGDLVDVSGFPSGSVVKCPITHLPFRVP